MAAANRPRRRLVPFEGAQSTAAHDLACATQFNCGNRSRRDALSHRLFLLYPRVGKKRFACNAGGISIYTGIALASAARSSASCVIGVGFFLAQSWIGLVAFLLNVSTKPGDVSGVFSVGKSH
jgi:hypothetical protein